MNKDQKDTNVKKEDTSKPDAATLHTTDPQKNMEGPVSSSTKQMGEAFDTNKNKKEADEERDRNL